MGKSIVAFNYKSQVSKNPLKKLSEFNTQASVEDNKTDGQFSPGNKIPLIPINKCFRMGLMQEIDFAKNSLNKLSNKLSNSLSNNSSNNLSNNLDKNTDNNQENNEGNYKSKWNFY